MLTPDIGTEPLRAVALKLFVPPAVTEADDGETVIVVSTGGTAVTVTTALPTTLALVAFTRAEPAASALKVTEAFPSDPVIA